MHVYNSIEKINTRIYDVLRTQRVKFMLMVRGARLKGAEDAVFL